MKQIRILDGEPIAGENPDQRRQVAKGRQPFGSGRLKPWQAYVFAIVATVSTLGFRLALDGQVGGQPTLVIFTVPIMLSAYVGGLRAGLLATGLSCVFATYCLLPPIHSFSVASAADRWQLFLVTLSGVVISALNEALHRARRRADIAIREHQQAEEALLKAGVLQSAIFKSANFSCIATDAKGVIQLFNVGAERMLGYTAAEVVNQITPADLHDPQEVIARATALSFECATPIAPGFEALAFKASRGIEDIYELTKVRKDGSRFPAVVSVTALRDTQNTIIGYLLIGTDNTARKEVEAERKRAQEERTAAESKFRGLVEQSLTGIYVIQDDRFVYVNPKMADIFGFSETELTSAPLVDFVYEEDRPLVDENIRQRLGGVTKSIRYALRARRKDGSVINIEAHGVRSEYNDRPAVLGTLLDVTDRRRSEEALQRTNVELERAKSAAEKANLAKSDFLSSMSHELRSPLNAILGFAQLMETASPAPTASQTKSIAQILQAGWYLLKLINEVLDLAVIESGKVSLSKEAVSLSELLSECQSMMEPEAQQRGIRMTFPQFETPVFVTADRTRLKQIVINLLSNAIKYNKEQGSVVVDCTASAPDRVRFSVRDTGAGLSPEKLAQLFSPFNRLGQETGSVVGTGIGLVVSKRLAELMEGAIGVESTVGVGSVFWCELNAAAAPQLKNQNGEAEDSAQLEASDEAPQRTLLYVEDNPANMQLVEELIGRFPDLKLITAVNGTLGIALARKTQPQVILMDINLPGISGIKALKILREDPTTAHIPVIALSANAMPRDIEKGLEAGFFRYLTKPIKIKELMDTLNVALEFAEETAHAGQLA